ncbi:MAG: glycosyltransferase family 2 protein [Prevotellaceae bacterium]|jgi:glycosyltransferase involved in cell wall biosynthesis|nr:glycosyltransferase family 2 protein [Prevotellaceae bacterium]
MDMDNNPVLTVFTPAYNRAYLLPQCYESLVRQTCKDFKWLVIDDGSTDNTKELVAGWINDGQIPIEYFHQKNQGMHGAHNAAYRLIETELNTCIDSDDYMPDDAVEKIVSFWKEKGGEKYAGLVGLDVTKNGKVIGTKFPDNSKETTLSGFYACGGHGDKKLVYRTEVINSYPEYPIFEGERFVPLDYKYLLADQDYKLLTLNEPLVVVEYMQDGSTKNIFRQYRKNPKGFAFSRLSRIQYGTTFKERFKNAIHLVSSAIFIGDYKWLLKTKRPMLILLAVPCGILLNLYIRINE